MIPIQPTHGIHYLRLKRNDYIRWLIFLALQHGRWKFDALLKLINEVFLQQEGFNSRHCISELGLRYMLHRNCEGAWKFRNGIVSLVPGYSGSLALMCGGRVDESRGKMGLMLILDDAIRDGKIKRVNQRGLYQSTAPCPASR